MTKAEECVEFVGKTAYYAALIVACSYVGATLARADGVPTSQVGSVPIKAKNIVVAPDYETQKSFEDASDEAEIKDEKLQYEPVTDELPVLEERKGKAETKDGSHYEEGIELHVAPEPGISPKDERIEEISEVSPPVAPPPMQ